MSDSCDPGIQASDVFTLQYFLLSIIILSIAYTKYKQYFMSGYKDVQIKNLYLKYLATFFSCSVIFSVFLAFVVKDKEKTILVILNTLLMMAILFSGLSEKNMKPFTATLSINLCLSIGCFIFYVIKIIKANPDSARTALDIAKSASKKAGQYGTAAVKKSGQLGTVAVKKAGQLGTVAVKKAGQLGASATEKAGQYGTVAFNTTSAAVNKAGKATLNTVSDATKKVADNIKKPFKKQNLQKNFEGTPQAFASSGVAKGIQSINQAVQNGKQDFIKNINRADPTNQKSRQNIKDLGNALKNTGVANILGLRKTIAQQQTKQV